MALIWLYCICSADPLHSLNTHFSRRCNASGGIRGGIYLHIRFDFCEGGKGEARMLTVWLWYCSSNLPPETKNLVSAIWQHLQIWPRSVKTDSNPFRLIKKHAIGFTVQNRLFTSLTAKSSGNLKGKLTISTCLSVWGLLRWRQQWAKPVGPVILLWEIMLFWPRKNIPRALLFPCICLHLKSCQAYGTRPENSWAMLHSQGLGRAFAKLNLCPWPKAEGKVSRRVYLAFLSIWKVSLRRYFTVMDRELQVCAAEGARWMLSPKLMNLQQILATAERSSR